MKKFIITIDTEGDNLWKWKQGDKIETRNIRYLQRFQDLCSEYGFKPVYLSNWEMICETAFVDFIERILQKKECELGMHLHAWNTPPLYELQGWKKSGLPYLIEYPVDIMEQKIATITEKMKRQFGFVPVSHRAGRWAINDMYFELLYKYGYRIDCSITPGISWKSSIGQQCGIKGPDYTKEKENIDIRNGIVEVPVTVEHTHKLFWQPQGAFVYNLKAGLHAVRGHNIWVRPDRCNLQELLWLVEKRKLQSNKDYIMFMLHSSELMPGGNPTFRNEREIELLYENLKILFKTISKYYVGSTLKDYVKTNRIEV